MLCLPPYQRRARYAAGMYLTVVCPRCGRPAADFRSFAGEIEIRAAGGTATKVTRPDGTIRCYEVATAPACKRHRQVRQWTAATLAEAYGAYLRRERISMDDIRRGLRQPAGFQGSGDGGAYGRSGGTPR